MAKPMMIYMPKMQFFDNNGIPLNGGKLFIYQAGTTTKINTFTDNTLNLANPNPIILDSSGRPSNNGAPIDLYVTQAFKMVIAPSTDTDPPMSPIWTEDNVTTLGQLVTLVNKTANYTIQLTDRDSFFTVDASNNSVTLVLPSAASAGSGFGVEFKKIDSSSNSVIIQGNGGDLIEGNNTLTTSAQYDWLGLYSDGTQWWRQSPTYATLTNITVTNASNLQGIVTLSNAVNEHQGSNIASATTTPIGAATGNFVAITGTTTITAFDTIQAGTRREVTFTGVLTLTYNATSLVLPGAANIVTAIGDTATFISLGSGNWLCTRYTRAIEPSYITKTNVQSFTTTGTYTPTAGMIYCYAEIWGAGGAGGSSAGAASTNSGAGGGGSGNYLKILYTAAQIGTNATVTIGAAGVAGSSGNNVGGNGGNTSFVPTAGTCTATGGTGGAGAASGANATAPLGGAGGAVSATTTGTVIMNVAGNNGFAGTINGSSPLSISGQGASGHAGSGAGGIAVSAANTAGNAGTGNSSGGSGGNSTSAGQVGGVGTKGMIIITELLSI